MIDRLRRKFIWITMGSVVAVLVLLMGIVNAANFAGEDRTASARLELLAENGGEFPKGDGVPWEMPEPPEELRGRFAGYGEMSKETPYETRYFSVELNSGGGLVSVNTGKIAAVSTEQAASMAEELCKRGKTSGYIGNYKYLAAALDTGGTRYIFVDCTRGLMSARSFLYTSLLVSLCGILAVLVLVLALSKRAIRPVAESYEKQKRFITNAGHEIKTPLAVIESCTEVIELEQGGSKWTAGIRDEVRRLASLTQSLVSLSRMDEGAGELQMADFSLSEAVTDALEPFKLLAESAGGRIEADIRPGLVLRGNEAAVRQLVSILADNGVKYALPGSAVAFSLQKRGRRAVLSTSNAAEGLRQGNMDELFDRFYRGDRSRGGEKSGYGIGLSMARSIIEAHGGRISAESPDGKTLVITALL